VKAARQVLVFDALILILLAISCVPFGLSALRDPDIGWHLATGLWIIEHTRVPVQDFLGPANNSWIAYSWLFDLAIGQVFRFSGFAGLQILQYLFVYLFSAGCYLFLLRRDERPGAHVFSALLFLASAPLLAPFWHLRPQLLSGAFFIFVLVHVTRGEKTKMLLPLTILWANIHVFWIFSPLLVLFFARSRKDCVQAALLACCGLCSPYSFSNYRVLWEYAFKHSSGYSLIEEFFPMSPQLGLFFWCWCIFCLILVYSSFRKPGVTNWRLFFLAISFAFLAGFQRKYLPYFALSCDLFLFQRYAGMLKAKIGEPRSLVFSAGVLLGLGCCVLRSLPLEPALTPETEELLKFAGRSETAESSLMFNEFDVGGWLGLGFYLGKEAGRDESRHKVSIDGRTLVWGQVRLDEFLHIRSRGEEFCELISKWQVSGALLKRDSPLAESLRRCSSRWRVLERGQYWITLREG